MTPDTPKTTTCEFEAAHPNEGWFDPGPPDVTGCTNPATMLVQFVEGDIVLPYLTCLEHAEAMHEGHTLLTQDEASRTAVFDTIYGTIEICPWDGQPLPSAEADELRPGLAWRPGDASK